MKYFKNYFLTDIRRVLAGPRTLAGMAGVAFSLFFSVLTSGNLTVKTGETAGFFFLNNIVSTYILALNMSGSILGYVFCALPFATVFAEEQEYRYARLSIIRGNLKSYVASKSLIIWLSSAAAILGGTLAYLLLMRIWIPWMDWEAAGQADYSAIISMCYGSFLKHRHAFLLCMAYALNQSFLAGMLSLGSAFVSLFIRNHLMQLIMPALLYLLALWLDIGGYSILIFTSCNLWKSDWANAVFLFILSAGVSTVLAYAIYRKLAAIQ